MSRPVQLALRIAATAVFLLAGIWVIVAGSLDFTWMGSLPLWQRAAVDDLAILLLFLTLSPWLSSARKFIWYALLLLILMLPAPFYYLVHLPASASDLVQAQQLDSALITESTSNGIIEVGFAYPIYTPTLLLRNSSLFTRSYDVYLRMYDGNGESSLFRAVRGTMPDQSLTVEAAVSGMLSKTDGYLFNSVVVAPRQEVVGKVVFIISNLRDGTTFNDALNSAYPAEFELRDPNSGDLLLQFPMTRI